MNCAAPGSGRAFCCVLPQTWLEISLRSKTEEQNTRARQLPCRLGVLAILPHRAQRDISPRHPTCSNEPKGGFAVAEKVEQGKHQQKENDESLQHSKEQQKQHGQESAHGKQTEFRGESTGGGQRQQSGSE